MEEGGIEVERKLTWRNGKSTDTVRDSATTFFS